MKIQIHEPKIVPDGKHIGVITAVEYRKEPFEYTDIIIGFKENEIDYSVKCGFPTMVTPISKLGKLLTKFGEKLKIGDEVDPDVLIGLQCQFVTITETTNKGKFAKVVQESIHPVDM